MEAEALLIDYMKKRAEFAKLSASGVVVQCFALAVFFCSYGLTSAYFSDSDCAASSKTIAILLCIIISVLVSVYLVFICFRYKVLLGMTPDKDIMRDGRSFVRQAYILSRPLLIYRITVGILIMLLSGLVYIILIIALGRMSMAAVYGRIVVSVLTGIAGYVILPALDRIMAYRKALKEDGLTESSEYRRNRYYLRMIVSVALPLSICVWYIIRFYSSNSDIGWMVFPLVALFGLAIYYLIGFARAAADE